MRSSYAASRKATRAYEGGKVDDPDDNGGRTAYGVTQRVYDAYRKNKKAKTQDVWLITEPEVDEIYLRQYWIPCRCDELPAGVDLMVFDAAIHSGPVQAIKWLQRALQPTYTGLIDGHYGEGTELAVGHVPAPVIIEGIRARRLAFMKQLHDWPKYKNGWSNRIAAVTKTSKNILAGAAAPVVVAEATTKASLQNAVALPSTTVGDAAASAGVAAGTFSGTLEGLRTSLQPYASTNATIQKLVIALIILGALLTVGGLAYRFYQQRKIAARRDGLDLPLSVPQAA